MNCIFDLCCVDKYCVGEYHYANNHKDNGKDGSKEKYPHAIFNGTHPHKMIPDITTYYKRYYFCLFPSVSFSGFDNFTHCQVRNFAKRTLLQVSLMVSWDDSAAI